VEREAFARAWRFLSYDPVAKWSSLLAAFCTGILYVALLLVLGLFAELAVSRGHLPAYADLTPTLQRSFLAHWKSLDPSEQRTLLTNLGVDESTAAALVATDTTRLTRADQALLWRSHLHGFLADHVSSHASTTVLPEFHDLPLRVQTAFAQHWPALPERDRDALLEQLGVELGRRRKLTESDLTKMNPEDRELIWRAYLYRHLLTHFELGTLVADFFWQDRARLDAAGVTGGEVADPELADRGVLSLAVRSQDHPYGSVVSWLARWNPWMWKFGNVPFLTGLLALAIGIAAVRAFLMYVTIYMAARATVEAANRLRRAVYHHTFRLGTLAVRALGPARLSVSLPGTWRPSTTGCTRT